MTGFNFGKIQHVIDEFQQVVASFEYLLHEVLVLAGQGIAVLQKLAKAQDGIHRRAQLVAHVG